jgi:hypothetical protein
MAMRFPVKPAVGTCSSGKWTGAKRERSRSVHVRATKVALATRSGHMNNGRGMCNKVKERNDVGARQLHDMNRKNTP